MLVLLLACSSGGGQGHEGQACLANDTCFPGLTCASHLCVNLSGAAGSDAAGSGAAGRGAAGMDAGAAAGSDGGAATDAMEAPAPPSAINAVLPGAGCGKPLPADQPMTVESTPKGYKHHSVMATGTTLAGISPEKAGERTFWVRVPADYDPDKAYRTVYIGQGCGAYNSANVQTSQLFDERKGGTEQAIYVALDIPTNNVNFDCYDTSGGEMSQEWEAFELFHTVVDANYCVDNNRVFVAGYSNGGALANMWGCYFAGDGQLPPSAGGPRKFASKYHVRGQASVASFPSALPPCWGPVAAFFLSDANDNVVGGRAISTLGDKNGCRTDLAAPATLVPWHPEVAAIGDVCQRFKGCPADYPVVVCTTMGLGHSSQDARFIPAVKLFFDEIGQPQ
jgi:hypothetical protein